MDEGTTFVIITSVLCCTGIAIKALNVLAARHSKAGDRQRLEAELAALRQEIAGLKAWTGDLVLTFDTTLQQYQQYLQTLERRMLGESSASGRMAVGTPVTRADAEPLEIRSRA